MMAAMNYINTYRWFLFIGCLAISNPASFAQEDIDLLSKKVTIAFEGLTTQETLAKLERELGISTAYNRRELNNEKVTISFERALLSEVLDGLLTNQSLSYKLIGNTITIFRKGPSKNKPKPANPEKYTISGYVMDAQSKESLIGATVFVSEIEKGISSNDYGFYSLTLPRGTYEISFSYIGYESMVKEIRLDQNIEFSPLLSVGNTLDEVVISADDASHRHAESKMSSNKISMAKVKSMPVLMGERDVLKIVQLMPGVQSGSEGSTGLYVRGGGADQNLMLLDGVPIYNANHLFGFLSTFNGDAIKSVEIIKGGFPARYGGRLSSIVDIRMKEGNMKEFHGDFTLGLISGKVNFEGPIIKDKTSFHLSARRTWLDVFTTPIQKNTKTQDGGTQFFAYHFYDLNAKINHKFSDKSRLYLSTYLGHDKLRTIIEEASYYEDAGLNWGNKIVTARWNYQLSPKFFSNTTVYYGSYDFGFKSLNKLSITDLETASYNSINSSDSKIRDYGAKIDVNLVSTPNHHIRVGIGGVLHKFTPTVNFQEFQQGSEPTTSSVQGNTKIQAKEFTAYFENDMALGQRLQLNAGIHLANFMVENSNYTSIQPRASLSFLLTKKSSLKLSYAHMTQFLHLLASPGLGLPTDLWVPSTDKIKPESSIQYAMGYTQSLGSGFEITLEGYYKTMMNLLEYKSGFNVFSNSLDWENKVLVGKGISYGVELLIEKTVGKTTGWLGYTLSKSDRTFPDIDNGETFPYKYDRRHDISLVITHKKSERLDFGLVWVYGSGNTYTLGTKNYNAISAGTEPLFANGFLSSMLPVNHIENRNNQRAPAYHRLDISANFHKEKKRGKRTWSFGFYNLYSRQNPFVVELKQKPNDILRLQQTSLLPIVPFASYSFKF